MGLSATLSQPGYRVALAMACLVAAGGVAMPYLPIWLAETHGLSGAEIGLILASAQLARIIIAPLLGAWADGAKDRRRPPLYLAAGSLAFYVAFFEVEGVVGLALTYFFAASLSSALSPLMEAQALRHGTGATPYGLIRGLASSSFIVANLAGSLLLARFGVGFAVLWILASMALTTLSMLLLPRDPNLAGERSYRARLSDGLGLARSRRFALIVAAAASIQAAHGFYYGFGSLAWRGQGFAEIWIGPLWAFGVVCEIAFFAALPLVERRISPRGLLVLGAVGAIVRWVAMAFAPPLWLTWGLQALHALSFASAHVGAMRLISAEAGPERAAFAQTLYSGMSGGLLLGLSTLGSGPLYDAFGAGGYLAMAVIAAAGLWLSLKLAPR
jgi:PPP family 3-phenylpropionic acid transporter